MVINLKDAPKNSNGCCVCRNMAGLKVLQIGSQKECTWITLCHICRTTLVGQLIDVR